MNDAAAAQRTVDGEQEQGTLVMSLIGAAHVIEDQIERALSAHGLSMAKLGVLTKLVEAGEPLTLSELAARIQCVRSNVTQLVDRLEDEDLVRRVDDAHDRRSIRAELTEAGRARHDAGARAMTEIQKRVLAALGGSAEQASLGQLLGRLG